MHGEDGGEAAPQFVLAPRLTDDDVQRLVETTARRIVRLCQRRGLFKDGATDPYWEQEPLLAQLAAASVSDHRDMDMVSSDSRSSITTQGRRMAGARAL